MLTTIFKQSKFKQSLDDIPLNCVHKSNWLRYVFQERSAAFFYIEEGSCIIQIYIYQTKQKLLKGGGRIVLMV